MARTNNDASSSSTRANRSLSVAFFDDPGSGLAEILSLAWVFIALVIGEVGLNILRWFTLGFDYAGNGFGPSTGCAGPSCKPRVLLKNELSRRRCHDHSFPQAGVDYQPVEIQNFTTTQSSGVCAIARLPCYHLSRGGITENGNLVYCCATVEEGTRARAKRSPTYRRGTCSFGEHQLERLVTPAHHVRCISPEDQPGAKSKMG